MTFAIAQAKTPATPKSLFTGRPHHQRRRRRHSRRCRRPCRSEAAAVPHPAAENLFASAWSACCRAIGRGAEEDQTANDAGGGYRDRLEPGGAYSCGRSVQPAGPRPRIVEELAAPRTLCPYSKGGPMAISR